MSCMGTGTILRKPERLSPRIAGTGQGKKILDLEPYSAQQKNVLCTVSICICTLVAQRSMHHLGIHLGNAAYGIFLFNFPLHSDTASLNSLGYCCIEGRIKDMIIRGGENIYPAEIEQFLYTHPKVQEVQVRFKTTGGQQSISK